MAIIFLGLFQRMDHLSAGNQASFPPAPIPNPIGRFFLSSTAQNRNTYRK